MMYHGDYFIDIHDHLRIISKNLSNYNHSFLSLNKLDIDYFNFQDGTVHAQFSKRYNNPLTITKYRLLAGEVHMKCSMTKVKTSLQLYWLLAGA